MRKYTSIRVCRSVFCVLAGCILLLSAPSFVRADDGSAKIGISASLHGDQTDILIPIWGGGYVFAPAFSVVHINDAVTDMGFGLIVRRNLRDEKAVPYISVRFGVLILNPAGGGDSMTDYVYGPAAGGEYFLDDHFSLAAEAQVNVSISDKDSFRFGNPDGTNVNTATAIIATFYF